MKLIIGLCFIGAGMYVGKPMELAAPLIAIGLLVAVTWLGDVMGEDLIG